MSNICGLFLWLVSQISAQFAAVLQRYTAQLRFGRFFMTNNIILHVDCGVKDPAMFGQHGTGYSKINTSPTERKTIYLASHNNTNNEAELFAILTGIAEGLNRRRSLKTKITIYSDSQWSVNSINHNWKIKEDRLKLIVESIKALIKEYQISLVWKPREELWAT